MAVPLADQEAVFGSRAKGKISGAEGDKEAIQLALELEEKSYDYYDGLARKAAGLFERRFFAALSYEERGHYLILLDSLDYLTDPSGWLERKEKILLDG